MAQFEKAIGDAARGGSGCFKFKKPVPDISQNLFKQNQNRILAAPCDQAVEHFRGRFRPDFFPSPTAEPSLRGYFGHFENVTAQIEAENHFRKNRSQLNRLLDNLPQVIWTTSASGELIYCNRRLKMYLRSSPHSKSWLSAVHPADAAEIAAKWNSSMVSGESFEAEFRLSSETILSDGSKRDRKAESAPSARWYFGRALPVRDESGKVVKWFGTATDIHDKKTVQSRREQTQRTVTRLQSLATSLAFARTPMEIAQLVVDQGLSALEVDAGCILLSANDSTHLHLLYANGYSQKSLDELKNLDRNSSAPIADAIRTGTAIFVERSQSQATTASVPLIVHGQTLGAIGLVSTTLENFNEERVGYLTILAEQCAQAIERARLFESEKRARNDARSAARAKSQFLANMSHEIRTPMNAILGFADMLGDKTLSADEREEYRDRIRMNGDHLMRLIDDLLDVSKSDPSRVQIEKVQFSICDLVRETHEAFFSMAKKKGIAMRLAIEATVPRIIESDPKRLRQILRNLIGNSIKFTDHGRIETRISAKVDAGSAGWLKIEIEDTGIGISPELRRRLFRPFVQADSSVTRRFGGPGLGLVVSRGLAEAMGGSLELVRSDSDQGSIFQLTIPFEPHLLDPQTDLFRDLPTPRKLPPNRGELEGVNLLLVEDSVDNEMLIRAYLKGTGAQIEVARNGEEAVNCALKSAFDLVLMDIQMPVMDGLEATRLLRKRNFNRPIIALSAHALPEEVERSIAAGCHSHLTKPILRNVLIDQIRSVAQPETSTSG